MSDVTLSASMPGEPFLALPPRVPAATQFRSTWLTSSLRALRKRSLLERYYEALPSQFHEAINNCIVGEWLPIEVAMAHYAACDSLRMPPAEIAEMGRETTQYAHATVFGVIARSAKSAGATPWTIFAHQQRLWERVWVGGGVGITRNGPKDAVLEIAGWPCARYQYVRIGMRGVVLGQCELVSQKSYVTEIARQCTSTSLTFKVSWV